MGGTKAATKKDGPAVPRKKTGRKAKESIVGFSPQETQAKMKARATGSKHLATNSQNSYAGVMKRATKWLSNLVEASASDPPSLAAQIGSDNSDDANYDVLDDPELSIALETPVKATPYIIAMYLTHQIVNKELSRSTLEQDRSAFKEYFKKKAGDRYRGRWRFENGVWVGNPVDSAMVDDLGKVLKVARRKTPRKHSLAFSRDRMRKLYEWSQRVCPDSLLSKSPEEMSIEERAHLTKHLCFRAYATLAWTVWARSNELMTLVVDALEFDVQRPNRPPCMVVNLQKRKGWEKKSLKGVSLEDQARNGTYNIYPLPPGDIGIDACHHVTRWIDFQIKYHFNDQKLDPDDYAFPAFHMTNGIISRGGRTPVLHDMFEVMLDEAVVGAGLMEGRRTTDKYTYSSHGFRRGRAQDKFMGAPTGYRWPLSRIAAFGGWAGPDQINTLLKYLLDELEAEETDHSDALCPIQRELDVSFLGEHKDLAPVTLIQHTTDVNNLNSKLDFVIDALTALKQAPPASAPPLPSLQVPVPRPQSGSLFVPSPLPTTTAAAPQLPPNPPQSQALRGRPLPPVEAPCLPALKPREGESLWEAVVRDWLEADPENDRLRVPLSKWDKSWYTGKHKNTHGSKYSQRRWIGQEFTLNCNSDRTVFLQNYPNADEITLKQLVELIRAKRLPPEKHRASKHGTPSDRGVL